MIEMRFSVRTLLIVVAVSGLLAAFFGGQIRRRYLYQRLNESLLADGCQIIDSTSLLVSNCTVSERTLDLVEKYDLSFSTLGVTNGDFANQIMRGLHQFRQSTEPAEQSVQVAMDELLKSFPYEQMSLEKSRHGCRLNVSGGKLSVKAAELLSKASPIYVVWTHASPSSEMQFEPGAEDVLLQSFRKHQEPGASAVSYGRL